MKILAIPVLAIILYSHLIKRGYEVGDTASDFRLKNVDGKMVSLSDYKNVEGYIVIFDCNTCPYSKAYNQRIIELNDKYAHKGFPVIAINANHGSGDSFQDMVRIARKKNYQFPYLIDETQQVAKTFGATNTPHVFVLMKNLVVAYIGTIDDSPTDALAANKHYVEDAVNALLENKPVPIVKTKAIGCGIRWKD